MGDKKVTFATDVDEEVDELGKKLKEQMRMEIKILREERDKLREYVWMR